MMKTIFRSSIFYILFLLKIVKLQLVQSTIVNRFSIDTDKTQKLNLAINVIQQCFNGKRKYLVVIGNFKSEEEFFILSRLYSRSMPMSLLSLHEDSVSNKRFRNYYYLNETIAKQKTYPAAYYVISASSQTEMSAAMEKVRNSIWWNHEGVFLIINTNFVNGCDITNDCLRLAWSTNVLSASFLCSNADDKMYLYTFNPYSDYAPSKFWNVDRSRSVPQPNNSWTLFEHTLQISDYINNSICENLNFTKTSNLNGNEIKIGALYGYTSPGNVELTRVIWKELNATTNMIIYKDSVYGNEREQPNDLFDDVWIGKLDYIMNTLFQRGIWKRQTYPHDSSGMCAIAHKRKILPITKLFGILKPESWCLVVMAFFVASLFLKSILKQSLSESILELMRMLFASPSHKQPATSSTRSFFTTFIFITMVANFYFQSRLSSLYIASNYCPVIDTIQDLIDSSIPIYGHPNFKEFFIDTDLRVKYNADKNIIQCLHRVGNGENIICLFPCFWFINSSNVLHVAKNKIRELQVAFMIREDWPLRCTVNKILRRLDEAGLYLLLKERDIQLAMRNQKMRRQSWPINIEQIAPIMLILVCHIIAFVVFLIEITIFKSRRTF